MLLANLLAEEYYPTALVLVVKIFH